jgi:5-hydroxyisourate hydrolase-like protein (transthyretin family)
MITSQVCDAVRGGAAARVRAQLDVFISGHGWREVGDGVTNDEGSILNFGEPAAAGIYRLMFDVASYWPDAFFPSIAVTFEVRDPARGCHLRLLLSRFGYTVYRV